MQIGRQLDSRQLHSDGIRRRDALMLAMAAAMIGGPATAAVTGGRLPKLGPSRPFSREILEQQARQLVARPYVEPVPVEAARHVTYDVLNHVQYRPEAELWPGQPSGAVRLFGLSVTAPLPVVVHVVEGGKAREVRYSPDLFSMPEDSPARQLTSDNGGFAGFRVMNQSGVGDWLAFLGASYFRSAGPLDQYGLSARGIALDTAVATPEEFPRFRSFWLEQTPAGLDVHALLDGPRVVGVWHFANRRTGNAITQDVSCRFFLRGNVERLGIAPLTSMYWYGESDSGETRDWRPEIHDSDGLLILNGRGEQLWRPLINPPRVHVSSFADRSPKAFGLLQRDRAYENYEDDGVFYHKRPSLWIEPQGDWGPGSVELVELPTQSEIEDNIVAFWRPAEPAVAGSTHDYRYRLSWITHEPGPQSLAPAVFTRRGHGGRPGEALKRDISKLVVDFEGPQLAGLDRNSGVEAQVHVARGQLISNYVYPVVGRQNRWRLMLEAAPENGATMELRATLVRSQAPLTETWLYQLHG